MMILHAAVTAGLLTATSAQVQASPQCVNHVTIYLDRSGSMLPQISAGVGHPSPFSLAAETIGGMSDLPFVKEAETKILPFDTKVDEEQAVELPSALQGARPKRNTQQELLNRRPPTPANGTDLLSVLQHIARQPDLGQRHLFVIISDFIQETRDDNLTDAQRAARWDLQAAGPLAALREYFQGHQRANILLLYSSPPDRSIELRSKIVESILAAVQRGLSEPLDVPVQTLGHDLQQIARPLQVQVVRAHGALNLTVENFTCPPQPAMVSTFRFADLNDRERQFSAGISAQVVLPNQPAVFTLGDELVKFRQPGPLAGTVIAMGHLGAVTGKETESSEMSLPAGFHRGNFFELLGARIKVDNTKRMTVRLQATGQLVDADSVKLVLDGDQDKAVDLKRCVANLDLDQPRELSITIAKEHRLSDTEVRDATVAIVADGQEKSVTLGRTHDGHTEKSEHDFAEHLVVPLLLAMPLIALSLWRRRVVGLRFFEEIIAIVTVAVTAQVAILQESTEVWETIERWSAEYSRLVAPICVLVTGLVFALAAWKGLFESKPPQSLLRQEFLQRTLTPAQRRRRRWRALAAASVLLVTAVSLGTVLASKAEVGRCTFETNGYHALPVKAFACP